MNAYEKLKKAMKAYEEYNTAKLNDAVMNNDSYEISKRSKRLYAILRCMQILNEV